ncbi:hypothetical protein [Nocardia neocaledoniensis]|uniref:hypothetical protein n=1 Tax=Nocardia neocaledoniensis TaxID=236511 RepID=UPI002454F4E4|nr:hypothetical protein [Nocardia neocaledoniensis]
MVAARKVWIGIVAGAVTLLVGCSAGNEASPGSTSRAATTSVVTVPLAAPPTADPTPAPVDLATATRVTTPAPPGPPPTPATGTIALRTETLSGTPVPNVPVWIGLRQPCDPAGHDIPVGETTETQRQEAVTDTDGRAVFTAPVGCYHYGMTAPAGTNPVPEGMHAAFLTTGGQTVDGKLRFQDAAGPCHPDGISADLGLLDNATVGWCDGTWAVISFDTPGDNQRIVHRVGGTWTTYVLFPHEVCWSTAEADGVPVALRAYFTC